MDVYENLESVNVKSGWWYTYLSEIYDFVSWDDDYSQVNGTINIMLTKY